MSLWKIALRSIQQRSLASTLTGISMALGVALVVAVLVLSSLIGESFNNNSSLGYNLIVGANKGGKLQLVLNTVFYLSSPVENIPYSYYKEFTEGRFKGYVQKAIPCCLGDYYDKFRVVGTTPDMFSLKYGGGRSYEFADGHNFKPDEFFTGVIGATVARDTGLRVGSKFQPTHGAPDGHQHDPFTVVGVLKPTGTPNDRALFVNIEGFYLLDNHARPEDEDHTAAEAAHAEHAHDHDHDDHVHEEHALDADHTHLDHEHNADDQHADHDHESHDQADHDHDAHRPEAEHDHDAAMPDADHEHADHDAHEHADHDAHEHADHDAHEHADHDAHEHADHDAHEHGHHGHHHDPLPESQREVTAVLLLTGAPGVPPELYAMDLMKTINKGQAAQAVLPIREIRGLFDLIVEPIEYVLLGLTVLIVVVSAIGILVSIYNSMSERRQEIAVMRALGAGRQTVMQIVLLESILLSLGGGLLGWLLGHLLIAGLSPWIAVQTGVSVGFFQSVPWELVIIPGLIVLASLVGYLPAMVAYRTDVAKALSAAP